MRMSLYDQNLLFASNIEINLFKMAAVSVGKIAPIRKCFS